MIFEFCVSNNLRIEKKRKHKSDQCWVGLDKDDFPAKDFNQAITLAQKNIFRVAYSNQAFEYWLLLHFNLYRDFLHRHSYVDMLSKLIKVPYS
ncbi:RloB family protein [uncultured Bacteroides sp.]|uniref:RloB family protein n=1 Tax=uncultured Bacteroides sp. TaxID=162156 RepID=UPI0035A5B3F0